MIHFGPTERFNCFGENVLCYSNLVGGLAFVCLSTDWKHVRLSCWVMTCGSIACLGSVIVHVNYSELDGNESELLCRPSGDRILVRLGSSLFKFLKLGWLDIMSGTLYNLQDAITMSQHFDTLNRDVIIHARLEVTNEVTIPNVVSLANLCIFNLPLVAIGCRNGVIWIYTWKGSKRIGLYVAREHGYIDCTVAKPIDSMTGPPPRLNNVFGVTETDAFMEEDEVDLEEVVRGEEANHHSVHLCQWNVVMNVGITLHPDEGSAGIVQFNYNDGVIANNAASNSNVNNAKLLAYKNLLDIGKFHNTLRIYPTVPASSGSQPVLSSWVRIESVYTTMTQSLCYDTATSVVTASAPAPLFPLKKTPTKAVEVGPSVSTTTLTVSSSLIPVWKCVGVIKTKELPVGWDEKGSHRVSDININKRKCRFSIAVFTVKCVSIDDSGKTYTCSNVKPKTSQMQGVVIEFLQLLPLWNSYNVYEYMKISYEVQISVAVVGGNRGGKGGGRKETGRQSNSGATSGGLGSGCESSQSPSILFIYLGTNYPVTCHSIDNLHIIHSNIVLKLSSTAFSSSNSKKLKVSIPLSEEDREISVDAPPVPCDSGEASGKRLDRHVVVVDDDSEPDDSDDDSDMNEHEADVLKEAHRLGAGGDGNSDSGADEARDEPTRRKYMTIDRRKRVFLYPLFGKLIVIESEFFQYYQHIEEISSGGSKHGKGVAFEKGGRNKRRHEAIISNKDLKYTAHISQIISDLKIAYDAAGGAPGTETGAATEENAESEVVKSKSEKNKNMEAARLLLKTLLIPSPTVTEKSESIKTDRHEKEEYSFGTGGVGKAINVTAASSSSIYVIPLICCVINNINSVVQEKLFVNISNSTILYYKVENDSRVPSIALSSTSSISKQKFAPGRVSSFSNLAERSARSDTMTSSNISQSENSSLYAALISAASNRRRDTNASLDLDDYYLEGEDCEDDEYSLPSGSPGRSQRSLHDDGSNRGTSVRNSTTMSAKAIEDAIDMTWHDTAGNVSSNSGNHTNTNEIYEDAKYLKRVKLPEKLLAEIITVQFLHAKNYSGNMLLVQEQQHLQYKEEPYMVVKTVSTDEYEDGGSVGPSQKHSTTTMSYGSNKRKNTCHIYNDNISLYGSLLISMSECCNYLTCSVDYSSIIRSTYNGESSGGDFQGVSDSMKYSSNGFVWIYSIRSSLWTKVDVSSNVCSPTGLIVPKMSMRPTSVLVCDDTIINDSNCGLTQCLPHRSDTSGYSFLSYSRNGVPLPGLSATASSEKGVKSELLCVVGSQWFRDHTLILLTYRKVSYPLGYGSTSVGGGSAGETGTISAAAVAAKLKAHNKAGSKSWGVATTIYPYMEIISREVKRPQHHGREKGKQSEKPAPSPALHKIIQLPRYFCSNEVSLLDIIADIRNPMSDVSSSDASEELVQLDQHFIVVLSDGYHILGLRVTAHATLGEVEADETEVYAGVDASDPVPAATPGEVYVSSPLVRSSSKQEEEPPPIFSSKLQEAVWFAKKQKEELIKAEEEHRQISNDPGLKRHASFSVRSQSPRRGASRAGVFGNLNNILSTSADIAKGQQERHLSMTKSMVQQQLPLSRGGDKVKDPIPNGHHPLLPVAMPAMDKGVAVVSDPSMLKETHEVETKTAGAPPVVPNSKPEIPEVAMSASTLYALQAVVFQPERYTVVKMWDVDLMQLSMEKDPAGKVPRPMLPIQQVCAMMLSSYTNIDETYGTFSQFNIVVRDRMNNSYMIDPIPQSAGNVKKHYHRDRHEEGGKDGATLSMFELYQAQKRILHSCKYLMSQCVQCVRFQEEWRIVPTPSGVAKPSHDSYKCSIFEKLHCFDASHKTHWENTSLTYDPATESGDNIGGDILLLQAADSFNCIHRDSKNQKKQSSRQKSQILLPLCASPPLENSCPLRAMECNIMIDLPSFSIFSPLLPISTPAAKYSGMPNGKKRRSSVVTTQYNGKSLPNLPRSFSVQSLGSPSSKMSDAGGGSPVSPNSTHSSRKILGREVSEVEDADDEGDDRIIVPWEVYQGVYFGQYTAGLASEGGGGGMWLGLLPSTLVLPHDAAPHISRHIHPAISICIKAEPMSCNLYEAVLAHRRQLVLKQLKLEKMRHVQKLNSKSGFRALERAKQRRMNARGVFIDKSSLNAVDSSMIHEEIEVALAKIKNLLGHRFWWRKLFNLTVDVASAHPSTLSLLIHYLEMKIKIVSDYKGFNNDNKEYNELLDTFINNDELLMINNTLLTLNGKSLGSGDGVAAQGAVGIGAGIGDVGNPNKLLLIEIVSRLTRKLEPGLRNKLFPIHCTAGDSTLNTTFALSQPQKYEITPLLMFIYCLKTRQLQHASRLLTLACDTIGDYVPSLSNFDGSVAISPDDDPSIAMLCLILSLELLYESLRHMALSIAIESYGFCIRLEAMILETVGVGLMLPRIVKDNPKPKPDLVVDTEVVNQSYNGKDMVRTNSNSESTSWLSYAYNTLTSPIYSMTSAEKSRWSPVGESLYPEPSMEYDPDSGIFVSASTESNDNGSEKVPACRAEPMESTGQDTSNYRYVWNAYAIVQAKFSSANDDHGVNSGLANLRKLFILPKWNQYQERMKQAQLRTEKRLAKEQKIREAFIDPNETSGLGIQNEASIDDSATLNIDIPKSDSTPSVEPSEDDEDEENAQRFGDQSYRDNFSVSSELLSVVCDELLVTGQFYSCSMVILNILMHPLIAQIFTRKLKDVICCKPPSTESLCTDVDMPMLQSLFVRFSLCPKLKNDNRHNSSSSGVDSVVSRPTSNKTMQTGTVESYAYLTAPLSICSVRLKCTKEMYIARTDTDLGTRISSSLVCCTLSNSDPSAEEDSLLPIESVRALFSLNMEDFTAKKCKKLPDVKHHHHHRHGTSATANLFDVSMQMMEVVASTNSTLNNNQKVRSILARTDSDLEDSEEDNGRSGMKKFVLSNKKLIHGVCIALLLTRRYLECAVVTASVLGQYDIAAAVMTIGFAQAEKLNVVSNKNKETNPKDSVDFDINKIVCEEDLSVIIQFYTNVFEYPRPDYYFNLFNVIDDNAALDATCEKSEADLESNDAIVNDEMKILGVSEMRVMYIERMKDIYNSMKSKNSTNENGGKSTLEEYMIILCNMCKVEVA